MSSPQTIEKQKGNQAMAHNNTVFSQLLKLVSRHEFESLAKQHHTGRAFRSASRWSQFVTMMMAQLAGRNSLRDIVENATAQAHRFYHLGSSKLSRSNLSRINNDKRNKHRHPYFERVESGNVLGAHFQISQG
jgi:hypothetical protein